MNKEIRNVHSSPDVFRVISSVRIRWTGSIARVGLMRSARFRLENLKYKVHMEDLGVYGRNIFKGIGCGLDTRGCV
jgi:hypothetical protein